MIERYYLFDVDRFLQDKKQNDRRLQELIEERDAAADSGGMDYGHIRGTGISDPTVQRANKRLRIEQQINELAEYMAAYDNLTQDLTAEEWEMVHYLSSRHKRKDLVRLANCLGYSEPTCYKLVNDFRRKLRQIAK